jgi:hypothetical protein
MHNEENFIVEELSSPGEKRAAVVIGRFNPPTKGHYHLISEVKKFIKKKKDLKLEATPVVVVIAGSKSDSNKQKNPLSGEDRIKFMKASGHANGVVFFTAKTAFEALSMLREKNYEPIAVGGGEERATDYLRILDKYFKDSDGNDIPHYEIELSREKTATDGGESDHGKILDKMKAGQDAELAEISASLARTAAKLGYFEEFASLVGLDKHPVLAKKMFKLVADAVNE